MRSNRHGRRPWLVVVLTVLALVVQWYVLTTLHERELTRVEAELIAQASATITALERQPTPTAVPTSAPSPQDPEEAIELALDAALEFMRDPHEPPQSLEEVADSGFTRAFQRQIEHLTDGGLRLSSRSSYELLSVELTLQEEDIVELLTHERWVYDEETMEGESVRCLVETSTQRYRLERRDTAWVVTDLTLEGTPTREPCAPASTAARKIL